MHDIAATPTICADIGGSFIKTGLVLPDGRVVDYRKVSTPTQDFDAFVDRLNDGVGRHGAFDLNISLAGLQHSSGLCIAVNIPCISHLHLARLLAERLHRTVRIGNDADCFTLAEAKIGAARGAASVLGVVLGTGVGGGLVLNNALVTGRDGLAGELGHGQIVPHVAGLDDTLPCFRCSCGQWGCIETIGGARGLERLDRWCSGGSVARDSGRIIAAWRDGEPAACRTLATYVSYVSAAIGLAVNLTGAEIVPVGGGLSSVPELIDALDRATRARILRADTGPLLVASALGRDAALIGASFLTTPG